MNQISQNRILNPYITFNTVVIHPNIQSLYNKFDQFIRDVIYNKPSVVLLSESQQ